MTFSALHRSTGRQRGPFTNELLDAAVEAGTREGLDVDWKSELPPSKGLAQTDFPKDVAAMANAGGGILVFGVEEVDGAATKRTDAGTIDEARERSLRGAAITAITPPVFGVRIHRLERRGENAVVVEVPSTVDGPHLIYRNEYFGAPIRTESDTVWMKERQIEAMYRSRFDERRFNSESLDRLHGAAAAGRDIDQRAWFIAAARPRQPRSGQRLSQDQVRSMLAQVAKVALEYAGQGGIHPIESVDRSNPRPGLRSWVSPNKAVHELSRWKESWLSVHDDGSVTLASAVGGHRGSFGQQLEGWQVQASAIECAVADVMATIRVASETTGSDEYDLRVSIESSGTEPLVIWTQDESGYPYDGVSTPLHQYVPIELTFSARQTDADYHRTMYEVARDCLNQGGITHLHVIRRPADPPSPDLS